MFLNSLLVYGTLLGAIPIIIHLLNKRRFRPVIWAAMEFLLQAVEQNARRLQLRDLILMAIRTAAVICLALGLARPAVRAHGFLGAGMKTGAVILLDNSLSMGYNNGRETRFDVGKRLARAIVAQLEPGSWCGLFTFNDDVRRPLGDPSPDLAYMEQELDRSVRLSDGGTNVEKALQYVRDEVFAKHREFILANREVYIITDMQSHAWNPRLTSSGFPALLKEISSSAGVYLINAGDAGAGNVAVTDLTPTDTLAAVDTPIAFVARVRNFGPSEVNGLALDVFVDPKGRDDKPTERLTVNVPAGETVSATFETRFATGGDHKVEVRLADDNLMADNRRYATVEVIDESRILLVDGSQQSTDDPLANETGYLRCALSPRDPENPERRGPVTTETVSQLRFAERNLLNYQAVVLSNVSRLPQTAVALLDRQVRAGLGLMVFLGDQVDPNVVNGLLGEGGAKLLPARIGPAWGDAPQVGVEKLPQHFSFATAPEKLSHPIMSDFNNPDFGAEFLSALKVYKAFDLVLPEESAAPGAESSGAPPGKPAVAQQGGGSARVVAWLANGKPAVVERTLGSGIILIFAFPATTAWSNLPTQPAFTIMTVRAANLLTRGNRAPKNLPVGMPIHGVVSVADQHTPVRITAPAFVQEIKGRTQESGGSIAVRPPEKLTRPELTTDGRAAFDYTDTDRAGFYDVVLDRTPRLSLVYAMNANTDVESALTAAVPPELKQNFPGFSFTFVAKSDDFELAARLASERRGTELWPWLLGMVFVLLALESVLANRWAPRD